MYAVLSVCALCAFYCLWRPEAVLDPLELEFQVVTYPVIGTRPGFSARTYMLLNPEQSL